MAFPVSARTTGELITASIWNADLKNNLNGIQAGTQALTQVTLDGQASEPSVSPAGDAVAYYDSTKNRFRRSLNAGSFETFGDTMTQTFRGLHLRTHPDFDVAVKKVMLVHADEIVFNDGTRIASGLDRLVADITVSGAGGLDTGTEQVSTWYEPYVIRKSSDGTLNMLLHRAKDYFLDESQTSDSATVQVRNTTNNRTAEAQTFDTDVTGDVEFVEVKLIQVGAVTGRIWAELRATSGGAPTGAALATSDKLDASRISGSASGVIIRFPFRNPVSLTAGTTYALVITGDWTQSDTNYIGAKYNVGGYGAGSCYELNSGSWVADAADDLWFKVYVTENDTSVASSLPSGYDQYAKVCQGIYNNSSGDFVPFEARDRRVRYLQDRSVGSITSATMDLLNLASVMPPGALSVQFSGSVSGSGESARIGAIPDGYSLTNSFSNRDNGVVWIYAPAADKGTFPDLLLTQYQAAYASVTGATLTLRCMGWEW